MIAHSALLDPSSGVSSPGADTTVGSMLRHAHGPPSMPMALRRAPTPSPLPWSSFRTPPPPPRATSMTPPPLHAVGTASPPPPVELLPGALPLPPVELFHAASSSSPSPLVDEVFLSSSSWRRVPGPRLASGEGRRATVVADGGSIGTCEKGGEEGERGGADLE
jgi:hypothetical protein